MGSKNFLRRYFSKDCEKVYRKAKQQKMFAFLYTARTHAQRDHGARSVEISAIFLFFSRRLNIAKAQCKSFENEIN